MAGFATGVNAIRTAAHLIDIAGDNIANASTPGYHVKRATVAPVIGPTTGGIRIGLGSSVEDVRRVRNELIERALLEHVEVSGRFGTELEVLTHLELLFAEPSGAGLSARLGEFFQSLNLLAGNPDDPTLREQVVQRAQMLCDTLNQLDAGLNAVMDNLLNDVDATVNRVNALSERIADLNGRIRMIETGGVSAGGLKDTRDQLISELAGLVNVSLYEADYGVVNVSCSGTLLVDGSLHVSLTATPTEDGLIVQREGAAGHRIDIREGRLGALLDLIDDVVPQYQSALDELANSLRRSVNLIHTTALGLAGRFHSLEGLNAFPDSEPFSDQGYGVSAGTTEKLVINVEDESTGEVIQYELTLDTTQAADAFLVSLRNAINATVVNVNATVVDNKLNLQANDGYAFGFATPYDPNPAEPGDITAATPTSPVVLGDYGGADDLVYEVTFLDAGAIGTDTINIRIDVRQPSGPILRTLNRQIDVDYDPRDLIEVENGLKLSLGAGNVAAADAFSFTAYAEMDTAGVLDALGLNVLFNGLGARGISVAERIVDEPNSLAGAMRPVLGDNQRLLDLADLQSENLMSAGTATLAGFYDTLVSYIGTSRNTRSVQFQNQEQLVKNLTNRRDSFSGVSIDEEMIRMIEARTLYQGALRYISIVDEMLSDLATLA